MTPKKQKELKQLRKGVSAQGRNWEQFFKLIREHYKHCEPAPRGPPSPEKEEFVADMLRAWNRPWDMWETEFVTRADLQDKNRKRQVGITSANDARQQRAEANYGRYREVAKALLAKNPLLHRATQQRLAQRVQTELAKQWGHHVSTRTIVRALTKKV